MMVQAAEGKPAPALPQLQVYTVAKYLKLNR